MPANRKPTALKLLHGNPGKRPLPENEPMNGIYKVASERAYSRIGMALSMLKRQIVIGHLTQLFRIEYLWIAHRRSPSLSSSLTSSFSGRLTRERSAGFKPNRAAIADASACHFRAADTIGCARIFTLPVKLP